MILGKASPTDMNLHPMHYKWAYDLYNQAVRNSWFPHEIPLGGADHELATADFDGQNAELPRLAGRDEGEGIGVGAQSPGVDVVGHLGVLGRPGVLDDFGLQIEQSFGDIAEGSPPGFLDLEDLIPLRLGDGAALHQNLTDPKNSLGHADAPRRGIPAAENRRDERSRSGIHLDWRIGARGRDE